MRKAIIGLLCLAGLVVVIDFGAAAYSEYHLSRDLRDGADLAADPEVTIHGFPFLGQSINGRYDSIEIKARSKRPEIPGDVALEALLTGVHVSLGDLIDGNVRSVPVERIEGRIRVEPTELGMLFGIPDLQVLGPPADKSDGTGGSGGSGLTTGGVLVLTGTMPEVPGSALSGKAVSVRADLSLDSDQVVHITATGIYRGTGAETTSTAMVTEAERPSVLEHFTRTIDTKAFPFGVQPTKVFALGGQIWIEGQSNNATIDLDRLQGP